MVKIMPKVWGEEHWITNRDYAGKKMVLHKGKQCGLHKHKIKDETFYVIKGKVLMENDGERRVMVPGDDQLILPNELHRFTGLKTSEIIEFSTHHTDEHDLDNYRLTTSGKPERETINKPEIYITGNRGYLGRSMEAVFRQKGKATMGSDIEFLDLTDRAKVLDELCALKPEIIVHTAALSHWLSCNKNPELAKQINVEATKTLVDFCKDTKIPFVYVSTDYIFGGEKGNYLEEDKPDPINNYGRTKADAEQIVRENLKDHLILRAGTFYGVSYLVDRPVFVHKVIRKLEKGEEYAIPVDEICNPTLIQDIGEVTLELLRLGKNGIWNVGGNDAISRYDLGYKVAGVFGLDENLIKKTTMQEQGKLGNTPQDSSLNMKKLNAEGIYTLGVGDGLKQMKESYDKLMMQREDLFKQISSQLKAAQGK